MLEKQLLRVSILTFYYSMNKKAKEFKALAALEAKDVMSVLAALHNSDMGVGGEDVVRGFGDKGVNSSIGSQWRQGSYRDVRYYDDRKNPDIKPAAYRKGRFAAMLHYAESVVLHDPDGRMDVRLVSCGEVKSRPNPNKKRTALDKARLGRDRRYDDRHTKGMT